MKDGKRFKALQRVKKVYNEQEKQGQYLINHKGENVRVSAKTAQNKMRDPIYDQVKGRFARAEDSVSAAVRRDTRIDVFRALALLTIFINHIPGTVYEWFTHKHFGFSDSAEAFVLVSGVAVGLAYGSKFTFGRRLPLTLKMWRRSWTLYCTHIMLTFATLALFCFGALYMRHGELLTQINIAPIFAEPSKAFIGIITLGHQLGYNNILPLYMVLMLFTPLILYMAHKNMRLLLIFSAALYFFAGFYGIAPHNYPTEGVWFLNPLSWQFLFVIGICAMLRCKQGFPLPQSPFLLLAALFYLVFSLVWVRWNLWWIDLRFGLPHNVTGFNKTFLSLPRLLHILAIAYLIAALPALAELARVRPHHPLAILGKYSLPVFACGTILAMAGQVLKQVNPAGGFAYDSLLIATGIVIQFAYAYYLEWLNDIKNRPQHCAAVAAGNRAVSKTAGGAALSGTAYKANAASSLPYHAACAAGRAAAKTAADSS